MKTNSAMNEQTTLERFAALSEDFLQMKESVIDYQKVCDIFLDLVHAKYCLFNIYNTEQGNFTTVAVSGNLEGIKKAGKLFGFNIINSQWPKDVEREALISQQIITKCNSLADLVGSRLSKLNVDILVKLFNLGESYIIKIAQKDTLLGDLMIIMDKNDTFKHKEEALIFTRQLGMLIAQKRTEKLLDQSNTKIIDIIEFLPDATFAVDIDGKVIIWNKAIERMTGVLSSEIIGHSENEYSVPFYGDKRPILIDLLLMPNINLESDYLNFKREEGFISAEKYCPKLNNGKGAWIYAKASPLHDSSHNIIGAIEIVRDITERKENEFSLRQSRENFSSLFQKAPLGYHSVDENGIIIEVNEDWLKTLGYNKNEVIGKWFGDFLFDDFLEEFKLRFQSFKNIGKIHSEFEMKHKNGGVRNIALDGRIGHRFDGGFEKTYCIIQDITDSKIAEEKLFESVQTYKALFEFSGVGIGYYSPEGYILSFNQKAAENMGGNSKDFEGKNIFDLFPKENAQFYFDRIVKCASTDQPQDYEDYVPLPTGDIWFFSTYTRIVDSQGKVKGIQIISQDISDIKNKQKEIEYLSYHDQLTGLYNRRFYEEELLRLNTPRNLPLTIAMGDVNGLKLVNDSMGHSAGDQLLVSVAESIKKACRQDDIIVRLGGDEFAVIFPKTDEQDANKIVERIVSYVSQEKVGPLNISISFGCETKVSEDESIDAVIKNTEDKMYRRKLNESSSMRNKTIYMIMNTLFEKNIREMKHSERVSEISVLIATEMGFDKDGINRIRTAGLMHDIGKIGIEESILNSKAILTNAEWVEIKKHTEVGYRILISASEFSDIAEDVYSHHERWDGRGYPRGIKEESISIFARIISIADSYDAMICERPYKAYRKSMSIKDAIDEIRKNAGTQFDPAIARIFVEKVMNSDW